MRFAREIGSVKLDLKVEVGIFDLNFAIKKAISMSSSLQISKGYDHLFELDSCRSISSSSVG